MPRMTTRGRVTIPKKVRTALDLRSGDKIHFIEMENGKFHIVVSKRAERRDQKSRRRTSALNDRKID